METAKQKYDCAIVGGGLAGLCLAIQLADQGFTVLVFEKNTYPFHKVCGEYISLESWDFLIKLGIPLADLALPRITELGISAENGFMLNAHLPLGGFGMSRYNLDHLLYLLAIQKKVRVVEGCKVFDVNQKTEGTFHITTSFGLFESFLVCGTFGKYSPHFAKELQEKKMTGPNYIGVKYHIKTTLDPKRIELHNFKNGYCGISKVDHETYCLCYLSDSENLQKSSASIKLLEEKILYKNPHLKKYFTQSEFVFEEPLVISNITFQKQGTYKNALFLAGDAAGSITPLCGNGMSMAMRASKILAELLTCDLNNDLSREALIQAYEYAWNNQFQMRIKTAYYLQSLFGKKRLSYYSLRLLAKSPGLTKKIISLTHGQSF